MKKNKLLIMALSLALCMAVSVGIALAYFTDYESASGGAVLHLSGRTEIEENFDGNDKLVSINNDEDGVDMVVRVMAYGENLNYSPETEGDWAPASEGSNIWYYTKVLKPGESTSDLRIHVNGEVDPGEPVEFEVTVVHESQRVTYTQDNSGANVAAAPDGWDGFPLIKAE